MQTHGEPMQAAGPCRDVRSLTLAELAAAVGAYGEPAYRADQIARWLYQQLAVDWSEMTNLPAALRERLAKDFALQWPVAVRLQGSADSTRKFLWRLADGAFIESVLIPASPALFGDSTDRQTLCISTQVGCAYGCRFCASGLDGWKRNLRVEEILGQVLAVERWHRAGQPGLQQAPPSAVPSPPAPVSGNPGAEDSQPVHGVAAPAASAGAVPAAGGCSPGSAESPAGRCVNNVVVMGMGEPLANYDALLKALTILNAPWGGAIGARKITVSTSGLVPQIRRLASEPFQFGLAISLHGATDAVRSQLMPVNRKYPLAELVSACEEYVRAKGRMITLEYILIEGVNDALSEVRPLAAVARRLHAKVNLIPYNRVEGLPWLRPTPEQQEAFLQALLDAGVSATLRREKGHDIDAACGQLRLRVERSAAGQ